MEREITKDEILQITQFLRKKGVMLFDIELELMDHFASKAEDVWRKSPNILLTSILQQEFERWGEYGFRRIVEAKKRSIRKTYYTSLIKTLLEPMSLLCSVLILGCLLVLNLLVPMVFSSLFLFGIPLVTWIFMMGIYESPPKSHQIKKCSFGDISNFFNSLILRHH